MNVSEISNYSDTLLQWQNGQAKNAATDTAKTSAQNPYGNGISMMDQVAGMVDLTKYAMDAMGLTADSRVTFSQIFKYREQLQQEFNQSVNNGLKALGIADTYSLEFTLQTNDDGTVNVSGNGPDRDKIQNFFDNNPDLIKKYKQIEALNGIEEARKALAIPPGEMRKRIQIESMAAWWTESNAAPSFGSYANNGISLLNGLDLTV
ncbi:MAG: hypothetical protein LBC94_09125 [Desulfovibrio sp.]|nr:hypothetical protein [Desulfovibrio sp.]